jgi:hypothetical protein
VQSGSRRSRKEHPFFLGRLAHWHNLTWSKGALGQYHDKVLPDNLREDDAGSPGRSSQEGKVDLRPRESLDLPSRRELV